MSTTTATTTTMHHEENRLNSYEGNWPQNAPVEPRSLARCGFFSTGNFLEVECNWCKNRIRDWDYGDVIEERHRNIAPSCMFLLNNACSGNVPLSEPQASTLITTAATNETAAQAQCTQTGGLLNEANRLATFKNWPNPNISPRSLAKAGFFYLNRSDEVKCAYCRGVIAKWEKQDDAFEEHKRFFPDCPRVQLGPLIQLASDGIRDLGIQQILPPKKPKYASLDARLRTYTNWPVPHIQQPDALAQAGLYYQSVDDQVRCFHCNVGLRSWQKEDDPWFEHAKWFPGCQFVRLVKGSQFIQNVQQTTREQAQETLANLSPAHPVMSLEDAMSTTPVKQALEMGIDAGSIRLVTQRHLEIKGRPYDTVEDLIKAVFGEREDDDDAAQNSDGSNSSIVREVSRIINSIVNGPNDSMPSTSAAGLTNGINSSTSTNPQSDYHQSVDIPPPIITTTTVAASTSTTTTSLTETTPPTSLSSKVVLIKPTTPTTCAVTDETNRGNTNTNETTDRNSALEEENRKLKDARLCKVCLDEEVGVVFLPCGHLVICVQCATTVELCPMCRSAIKGFVRTYLS